MPKPKFSEGCIFTLENMKVVEGVGIRTGGDEEDVKRPLLFRGVVMLSNHAILRLRNKRWCACFVREKGVSRGLIDGFVTKECSTF